MSADRDDLARCGHCGMPVRGFAQVGDVAVCHADSPFPDCYRLVTVYGESLGARAAAEGPDVEARDVERLCEVMHDAYEAAATEQGWETQARSRKPWSEVPEANKATMRVAVRALRAALTPTTGTEQQS